MAPFELKLGENAFQNVGTRRLIFRRYPTTPSKIKVSFCSVLSIGGVKNRGANFDINHGSISFGQVSGYIVSAIT